MSVLKGLPEIFRKSEQFEKIEQEPGEVAEKKDDHDANKDSSKRHLALHVLVPGRFYAFTV